MKLAPYCVFLYAVCVCVCGLSYLIKPRVCVHTVHASWYWHTSLSSIVSVKAIGWRGGLTERYVTAGWWEALFMTGGRRTPSCKCLLSVMDKLPVTEEGSRIHMQYNIKSLSDYFKKVMWFLSTHCKTSRCSKLYLPPFFKATLWMPSIALSIDCNTSSCSGAWRTEWAKN